MTRATPRSRGFPSFAGDTKKKPADFLPRPARFLLCNGIPRTSYAKDTYRPGILAVIIGSYHARINADHHE